MFRQIAGSDIVELIGILLFLGVVGYLLWRREESRATIADLREQLEVATRDRHICRPPVWGPGRSGNWIRPEQGSNYACTCGTHYVLVKIFQPRANGPWRLGWITVEERATGCVPPGVRQEPESRLDYVPGVHRREGAL